MCTLIDMGQSRFTEIYAVGKRGKGNAYREYQIRRKQDDTVLSLIYFQDGVVKDTEVNGIFNEDLINIIIHRLESFQAGDYPCTENAQAIKHLKAGLSYLNSRTADRQARDVEGEYTK